MQAGRRDRAEHRDVVAERWNAVGPKSNMWMDPAQDPRFAAGAELEGERATPLDYLRAYLPGTVWPRFAAAGRWRSPDPGLLLSGWPAGGDSPGRGGGPPPGR
jgi:hypothetical protein